MAWPAPRVRIGRSRDNDILLPERDGALSSSHHAEAHLEGGDWWILDLHSTNGTIVNGERVTRQRLSPGDQLTFGDEQLLVCEGPRRSRWPIFALLLVLVGAIAFVAAYLLLGRPAPLEDLAASLPRSVYLVTTEERGQRDVIGTAFAVRPDLLATNAHVASELRKRASLGGAAAAVALAVRSDAPADLHRIVDAVQHPAWQPGSIADDVAVLRLEPGAPLMPLPLGDRAAFAAVHRGAWLATFGFPVASTNPWKPRGRFSVDVAGDVRDERYVEVGLGIAPGTSGSPILDANRRVVAIVVAGDFLPIPGRAAVPSGSAANWGISVAALHDLLGRLP